MTKKEKQIFALQWAKVYCYKYLQKVLESRFSDLEVSTVQDTTFLKVYLFKSNVYFNKKQLTHQLLRLCEIYCPSLNFSVVYLDSKEAAETTMNPKYYFERMNFGYTRFKINPFNYLTKMEAAPLSQTIEGLRIVVKGKRGARKFKKTFVKGKISHHSLKPGVLRFYKGEIKTPLGIIGVQASTKLRSK